MLLINLIKLNSLEKRRRKNNEENFRNYFCNCYVATNGFYYCFCSKCKLPNSNRKS